MARSARALLYAAAAMLLVRSNGPYFMTFKPILTKNFLSRSWERDRIQSGGKSKMPHLSVGDQFAFASIGLAGAAGWALQSGNDTLE